MKKLYTLIATCLLLLFVTPLQSIDAGVGHSRSGSSSRSSSRSSSSSSGGGSRSGGSSYHYYRSGYESSSSSSSNPFEMGLVFLIAAGVFLVYIFQSSKNNSEDSSTTYTSNDSQTLHRRIEHNTLAISRVKYGDPNFDASAFTSWAKEVYIQLQAAWTKKDWNLVRSLESASLYTQHSAQLEDYIQSQTTNILERVYVENVRIKDFHENPDGNDTLVVILSSILRDYVIDDKTRKVIEGDPQKDLFTVYQMNFIRKHGSQTESSVQDEAVSDRCPNCGAPLKISAISKCDYCGAELTRSPNQWVLDTYEVVDEDELYN